jgi:hypothetical protein
MQQQAQTTKLLPLPMAPSTSRTAFGTDDLEQIFTREKHVDENKTVPRARMQRSHRSRASRRVVD